MKILLLTRYARKGASSRIRCYQYINYLGEHSVEVTALPFFDDAHVAAVAQDRRPNVRRAMNAYQHRVRSLVRARGLDLIWMQYEALPWLPDLFERWLMPAGVPYVVDYDDAQFHQYDLNSSAVVRWLLKDKLDGIMARAAAVLAGNDYLASRARQAGANEVLVLPSAVDVRRYRTSLNDTPSRFTIGWIGSPTTARYLQLIADALREASRQLPARVVLVGSGPIDLPGVPVEVRTWQESTEADEIGNFDVGIMPLTDGPWEQGKCGFKLLQYMAAGLPAIASPVGANKVIVRHGTTGFLATTSDDWMRAFVALAESKELRTRMGLAGRQVVEREYSTSVMAPRLLETLIRAARPVET
jgi:glycosyltransferase involved in cell wall biosynthesis